MSTYDWDTEATVTTYMNAHDDCVACGDRREQVYMSRRFDSDEGMMMNSELTKHGSVCVKEKVCIPAVGSGCDGVGVAYFGREAVRRIGCGSVKPCLLRS